MSQAVRAAKDLWQDYLFLTKEMHKFLLRQDIDMVLTLMEQRDKLQDMIDQADDAAFRSSDEGGYLLNTIRAANTLIEDKLRFTYHQAKQQQEVAQSYEGRGMDNTGMRLDVQR